jgi:hypothetical protein
MQCIKCFTFLEEFAPDHPMGGIHIKSYGHYGSSVIDSMYHREYIDFFICDECLTFAAKHGRVRRFEEGPLMRESRLIDF